VIVYQTERVTLHAGDALDVLPTIPTEAVDLVVTDPPYGAEWRSDRRRDLFDHITNDRPADRAGIAEALEHCVRVVGQHRHLYIFGPTDVLDGLKVAEPVQLIWSKDRNGMGDLSAPWAPAHEPITFAVSKHRHAGETGRPNLAARLRKGSVLTVPAPTGRNVRHPSEKPTRLLAELIESSSRVGEMVLDPFAGVGSTLVAAVLLGRRAIGIELDPRYAEVAIDRLRRAEATRATAEGV
jgi:site-specific DNA-methyltransferase (adenine-specific)